MPEKMIRKIANKSGMVAIALAGVLVLLWILLFRGDNERAWHSLLLNYLFFNSLAAGLVVWPAIIVSAYGNWMGSTERICWTGLSFAIPSIIMLIVLWIGSGNWVPWRVPYHHAEWWIDNTFIFVRNLIAQLIFWGMAFYVFSRRNKPNFRLSAGWFLFVYAMTFSLLGFDFVMSLDPEWYSMMMGGYYFISGLYIAVAAWIILSIAIEKPPKKRLHDMGKLLIAFCMLTSYLMFSQLFPIWYENIPHETSFLVPRMNFSWKHISRILLAIVYLGPIFILLSSTIKRNYAALGIISLVILTGMWMERWWLVSAVFEKENIIFGWIELLPALALLAVLAAGILSVFPYVSGKIPGEFEEDLET